MANADTQAESTSKSTSRVEGLPGLRSIRGFTLVEMAVVLTVIALIGTFGMRSLGAFVDNAQQNKTQGSLEISKRALLNYVKINRHMPCPDLDGDGRITDPEDLDGNRCKGYLGTLPYHNLGLSQANASDEWGHVFGYGVHQQASQAAVMGLDVFDTSSGGGAELLAGYAGSYFYAAGAPAFTLQTPPTNSHPDVVSESFTICKRTAADDCSAVADKELEQIQAVVVAFNENGGVTGLNGCNTGARGARETENCNADMQLIKGTFKSGVFDDQLVTVSAYEIKQQVLDLLNSIAFNANTSSGGLNLPAGFVYIVNSDMSSTNDLNVGSNDDDRFFVNGNVDKSINTKQGNDWVAVMGQINAKINAGAGSDTLYVSEQAYPPAANTEAARLDKLEQVEQLSDVDSFEQVCYYPDDGVLANALCYVK